MGNGRPNAGSWSDAFADVTHLNTPAEDAQTTDDAKTNERAYQTLVGWLNEPALVVS
jgi:hypothetical protein